MWTFFESAPYVFLLKREIVMAKVDDSFDEACNRGDKRPAEQQV
jgi:hypothetical protein